MSAANHILTRPLFTTTKRTIVESSLSLSVHTVLTKHGSREILRNMWSASTERQIFVLGLETPKSPLLKITCGKRDSCVAHVSKTLRTFFVIIEENFMFLHHWLGNVVSIAYYFYAEKNTIIPIRPIKL